MDTCTGTAPRKHTPTAANPAAIRICLPSLCKQYRAPSEEEFRSSRTVPVILVPLRLRPAASPVQSSWAMDQVPPLFAHALRYVPGDAVRTPFGPGTVASSSSTRCVLPCSLFGVPEVLTDSLILVRAILQWNSQAGQCCTLVYVACVFAV